MIFPPSTIAAPPPQKKIQTTNFVLTLGRISIDLKPIDLKAMDLWIKVGAQKAGALWINFQSY